MKERLIRSIGVSMECVYLPVTPGKAPQTTLLPLLPPPRVMLQMTRWESHEQVAVALGFC